MFGNLFEEVNSGEVIANVHCARQSMAVPPPPRLPSGLCGIKNQGATCYLNSLLQTLLYTPEFREGLFQIQEEELGSLEDKDKGSKIRIIPLQLQRLFSRLLLAHQQAASTTELTDSFGWNNHEELQHHDVQELNRILFSAIESSLVGTSGKYLISQLYHGSTVSEIICQVCGKISEKEEDFLDLNVIVSGFNGLQESLNATFLQKEVMKGKNQYRCSTCCNLVDAKKGVKIRCLPPILTFSLLRFSYDLSKGERYKETGKFVFPMELDMSSYCDKEMKPDDSQYELFSVLIHSGNSYGGHYHAYIRDVDYLGKWIPPEEESNLSEFSAKENIENPVEIIKCVLKTQASHSLHIDALCVELAKTIGHSWNKWFKKTWGPINKFLIKHDDVFSINQSTNIVYLKEDSLSFESSSSCNTNYHICNGDETSGSPKESRKGLVMNTLKLSFLDKKKSHSSSTTFGHYWFDFNDSVVTSVYPKDIEKQFSGKECAYMLFYRRKSLLRPLEARGKLFYMIPKKLQELVEMEDKILHLQREEYEVALNTVTLQVHLGAHYRFYHGALEPVPDTLSIVELSIDRRKTLEDLHKKIIELGSTFCPDTNFTLHMIHEVPAGLHLIEEFPLSQGHMVLRDLGILEGTKIFLWDGMQVGGESFPVGPLHTPILLNITCHLPADEIQELTWGFPKSMTLGELRVTLCDITPLTLDGLTVSKVDMQAGEDNKLITLDMSQNGNTIEEIGLLDGDCLWAKCSIEEDDISSSLEERSSLSIVVQNRCGVFGDLPAFECPEINLEIDPEMSIRSAKSFIMDKLGLSDDKEYRLCKVFEGQGKKPPLHETQAVKDAGLEDVHHIIIEEQPPPQENQITLMFSIGSVAGDSPDYEITVDKSCSISQLLKDMLIVAGLEGDGWHLRKTSWCGEPIEALPEYGASLEEENLQHGEFLLILEGRLPPRGYLTLSVWLHRTPDSFHDPHQADANLVVDDMEGEWTSDCSNPLLKLGEVELSSESVLAELKRQILTLPNLANVCLVNVRYLRLRLLEGGRLGRILRGLSVTLRKLKLYNHQNLCAQLLNKEEDLLQNDVLLNVCQRIPKLRTYMLPVELVWDSGKSATFKSLKQSLSDNLEIPAERLAVAKYFPETYQWLIIDDGGGGQRNKASKKRWSSKKIKLRCAPYFFKDGDTIGVQKRETESEDLEDFSTVADDAGREKLTALAEENKLKRQEQSASSGSGEWILGGSDKMSSHHSKLPEVGIKIHVEDFS